MHNFFVMNRYIKTSWRMRMKSRCVGSSYEVRAMIFSRPEPRCGKDGANQIEEVNDEEGRTDRLRHCLRRRSHEQ